MFWRQTDRRDVEMQRPRRDEVALVRRSRKSRVGVVEIVRRPFGGDGRVRPAEPVVVGEVVVKANRRLVLEELGWALPDIAVVERIAVGAAGSGRLRRGVNLQLQAQAGWIGRGDLTVGGGQLQHVDLTHLVTELVAEPAMYMRELKVVRVRVKLLGKRICS